MKYLLIAIAFVVLSIGCSEKKDASQNLIKKQNKEIADEKNKQKNIDVSNSQMELPVSDTKKELKKTEEQPHKEIQAKFNEHAECVKSQNVDILKDSVRFKAVFDSCWQERMIKM
jgi:septal ring factor EnvC (AmiA/AmiB activator)